MVNPRPSKICILLLSLFLLVVPSLQVTNHTDNILDIHKFLDFIETRINYAIESKTNDITTAKSQLAQEHEVKTTNLEEMHDDYIASKATAIAKYEAAQEAADHEFQQAMAAVKDKEHQLNTTKDALHNFEAYIDSEHDRMDQNLAKFIQNMEAELQLVVEIRTILDALHSRSVKGVLEHCDEQYSCRGSLQCVESVCLAPPKESCEQSNECTPGSICHHSQCLKSIGQSCSRHEDCSTARCDSSQGKCHGILDSLEMHLALNPFMPSNRPL